MTRHTPQWLQAGSYPAAMDRDLIGALWPAPASVGLAVTAGSTMTLNVAAGRVAIPTGNQTGAVLCTSDANEQVTLSAAPASGTNRIDLVVAMVRGGDIDGGSNDDWIITSVAGAPAASPVAPAVPANCVALAQVYVTGGTAAIVAGNITDRRPADLSIARPGNMRVIAEMVRTTNFGLTATEQAVPGATATFVPVAGRQYFMRHAYPISVTTSLFHEFRGRLGTVTGTQLAIATLVQNNLAVLWNEATLPLTALPSGSPVTVIGTVRETTATGTITAAAGSAGYWQILERDGLAPIAIA